MAKRSNDNHLWLCAAPVQDMDDSEVLMEKGTLPPPKATQHLIKFELQLYKVRDGEYCVDVQVRPLPPISCDLDWCCGSVRDLLLIGLRGSGLRRGSMASFSASWTSAAAFWAV